MYNAEMQMIVSVFFLNVTDQVTNAGKESLRQYECFPHFVLSACYGYFNIDNAVIERLREQTFSLRYGIISTQSQLVFLSREGIIDQRMESTGDVEGLFRLCRCHLSPEAKGYAFIFREFDIERFPIILLMPFQSASFKGLIQQRIPG